MDRKIAKSGNFLSKGGSQLPWEVTSESFRKEAASPTTETSSAHTLAT
jgi:hypothetical protein